MKIPDDQDPVFVLGFGLAVLAFGSFLVIGYERLARFMNRRHPRLVRFLYPPGRFESSESVGSVRNARRIGIGAVLIGTFCVSWYLAQLRH